MLSSSFVTAFRQVGAEEVVEARGTAGANDTLPLLTLLALALAIIGVLAYLVFRTEKPKRKVN